MWINFWIIAGILAAISFVVYRFNSSYTVICPRCNVIVIMIDSLRADALPCYGYRYNTAPNICNYAKRSFLFRNAYANASWTLPSEVSLFTGLYTSSHRVKRAIQDSLNPTVTTLPQIFQDNGYKTVAVTNFQQNVGLEQGLERGFDTIKISSNSSEEIENLINAVDSIEESNRRRKPAFLFIHTDTVQRYQDALLSYPDTFPLDPTYPTPQLPRGVNSFTDKTWRLLKDRLLYLSNSGAQTPEQKLYAALSEKIQHATSVAQAYEVFLQLPKYKQNQILVGAGNLQLQQILGDGYLPLLRHVYDDSIRNVDSIISDTLERISSRGLDRNTIVIISSEHGEMLGEHNLIGHYLKLYKPEIQIPLIIHIPRTHAKKIDALASHVDIFHTLVKLTGIQATIPSSSISFAELMRGDRSANIRTSAITEAGVGGHTKSIITPMWHLIERITETTVQHELYDNINDPEENQNVAGINPQVVAELVQELHNTLDAQPYYLPETKTIPEWIDEEHRKLLIETGYF